MKKSIISAIILACASMSSMADYYSMDKQGFHMNPPYGVVPITPVINALSPIQVPNSLLVNLNGNGLKECPWQYSCRGEDCFGKYIDDVASFKHTGMYLPTMYYPICSLGKERKPTPVIFGTGEEGIGYTMTSDELSNWKPHTKKINNGIAGVYLINSLIRDSKPKVYPWGENCRWDCDNRIYSDIKVETTGTLVEAGYQSQVQNNIRIGFQLVNCDPKIHSCALTFNMKMACAGKYCGHPKEYLGWTSKGFSDAGQSGMGVFISYLPEKGKKLKSSLKAKYDPADGKYKFGELLEYGTSIGAKTKKGKYCKTMFGVRITWGEFKNILKVLADDVGQTPRERYGDSWDDRHNVRLISTGVGTENVVIGQPESNWATFGGILHSINITANIAR